MIGIRSVFVTSLALVALVVVPASTAHADESAAREHFRRGVALYDKKDFDAALSEFRAAYAERPSPGIKQNVALCLLGLQRPVEAATVFDEALEEGRDSLKPETRAAIERELEELSKIVATIEFDVVAEGSRRGLDSATITISREGRPEQVVRAGALRRPIRLEPGIYVFRAHVDGFADPPVKKLSLLADSPVDAVFELSKTGTVTLRPDIEGTTLRVDGRDVGRAPWTGALQPGAHRIEATAPNRMVTTVDIVVTAGTSIDYPIAMRFPPSAPDAYFAPKRSTPAREKRWYVAAHGAIEGESLRFSAALGESVQGRRRSLSGGAIGARVGFRFVRLLSLELTADLGSMSAKYSLAPTDTLDTDTTVKHWQIVPMIRFSTVGKVRFSAGSGVGFHHNALDANVYRDPIIANVRGSGTSAVWRLDLGLQIDVGPIFLEGAFFGDVNGVIGIREETGQRLLLDSPATRLGFRAGLGIPF